MPAIPRTRRADTTKPGIARVRRGRGFSYRDPHGEPVEDPATIARIGQLAVPPAWSEVWISVDPLGHIQATGIDAAGRKQYRYHDAWRARRDAAKFDAMLDFARLLPRLRRRVARDLGGDGLERDRIAACAVRLLDLGFFRIGSEDYAEQNGTYGLTTLRREHVRVRAAAVVFDYPAKHGLRRVQEIAEPTVRDLVCTLKRRRGGGEELLAFKRSGRWADLKAEDVNAYLKDATGGDVSAKDFRTWNATALCALVLARRAAEAGPRASRKRIATAAIREVAGYLGNTPAVCRRSYVDPRVLDRFAAGQTIAPTLARGLEPPPAASEDAAQPVDQRSVSEQVRRAVLDLIG
ncbi:DNA topoisomerase IB [Conexibacter sp. JD483]|uniref:DNA topoisomerase IB n=1 Tax=unclassified Conexibacter TaxID=2627773 RepID=UPI0027285F6B|nr:MULTISPECIES: DNA topoisomerase IB [unclassified Conexibacter]MDO8187309.1 DNA topoisomerase IB [Conexibacter sp. CPCC 205706]MDO8200558.1 DNA topoisomerase IB [Conexibacter sp. CPCC 205762]MDR9369973.1 DNA topoisomerase IB [Conexibacter sp. JD483]